MGTRDLKSLRPNSGEMSDYFLKETQTMEDNKDKIEEHIGLTQSDAFEQTTSGDSVTTKHLFADGGDGKEKEANLRSHHAGASSEAPASSGIPSAVKQHGEEGDAVDDQTQPAMAGHVQPATQSTQ
jgi:hypothetical protein